MALCSGNQLYILRIVRERVCPQNFNYVYNAMQMTVDYQLNESFNFHIDDQIASLY